MTDTTKNSDKRTESPFETIDLKFITALIAGALGVPGVIILAIIELL